MWENNWNSYHRPEKLDLGDNFRAYMTTELIIANNHL